MDFQTTVLQPLLAAVLTAAMSIIVAIVTYIAFLAAAYFQGKKAELKAKLGEKNYAALEALVITVIQAGQQMKAFDPLLKDAAAVKDWAITRVQALADARGLNAPVELVEVILESAILNGWQKGGTPVPALASGGMVTRTTTETTIDAPSTTKTIVDKAPAPPVDPDKTPVPGDVPTVPDNVPSALTPAGTIVQVSPAVDNANTADGFVPPTLPPGFGA